MSDVCEVLGAKIHFINVHGVYEILNIKRHEIFRLLNEHIIFTRP